MYYSYYINNASCKIWNFFKQSAFYETNSPHQITIKTKSSDNFCGIKWTEKVWIKEFRSQFRIRCYLMFLTLACFNVLKLISCFIMRFFRRLFLIKVELAIVLFPQYKLFQELRSSTKYNKDSNQKQRLIQAHTQKQVPNACQL